MVRANRRKCYGVCAVVAVMCLAGSGRAQDARTPHAKAACGAPAQDAGIVLRTWGTACSAPTKPQNPSSKGEGGAAGEQDNPRAQAGVPVPLGLVLVAQVTTGAEASEVPRGTGERITRYTLSPEREAKARALAKVRLRTLIVGTVYGLAVLLLILWKRWAAAYRDVAEKASGRLWVQALVFAPLIAVTMDVLLLPTGIYDNWIERQYGLSVQGWGSWFCDCTKA